MFRQFSSRLLDYPEIPSMLAWINIPFTIESETTLLYASTLSLTYDVHHVKAIQFFCYLPWYYIIMSANHCLLGVLPDTLASVCCKITFACHMYSKTYWTFCYFIIGGMPNGGWRTVPCWWLVICFCHSTIDDYLSCHFEMSFRWLLIWYSTRKC
jgi:hypothetical protein